MRDRDERLHCEGCGSPMNRHARKCAEPTDARQAALVDRELGGVVREIHGCPRCGAVAARTVPPRAHR
jgi:hypothetical protein